MESECLVLEWVRGRPNDIHSLDHSRDRDTGTEILRNWKTYHPNDQEEQSGLQRQQPQGTEERRM